MVHLGPPTVLWPLLNPENPEKNKIPNPELAPENMKKRPKNYKSGPFWVIFSFGGQPEMGDFVYIYIYIERDNAIIIAAHLNWWAIFRL